MQKNFQKSAKNAKKIVAFLVIDNFLLNQYTIGKINTYMSSMMYYFRRTI